jgi:hypothetical protein
MPQTHIIISFPANSCRPNSDGWNDSPSYAFFSSQMIGEDMVGRSYFVRQAAALLGVARKTADPNLAAALVGKAADYLSQIDEAVPPLDRSPQPPDVEPSRG